MKVFCRNRNISEQIVEEFCVHNTSDLHAIKVSLEPFQSFNNSPGKMPIFFKGNITFQN